MVGSGNCIVKFTIGVVVLYFVYLLFSSPGVVVVNTNGEIKGANNQLRVLLKRKSFWDGQLQKIYEQMELINTYPERTSEVKSSMDKQSTEEEELNRKFEEFKLKKIEELEQIKIIVKSKMLS